MGLALEVMGCVDHESWLSSEDPTFVIPSSVALSAKQQLLLQAAGVQQGVAFCLTDDGSLAPPDTKRFRLRMARSDALLVSNSLRLAEVSRGHFSLEFTYCATAPVRCTISSHVLDETTCTAISTKHLGVRWGPFDLPAGMHRHWSSVSHFTPSDNANTSTQSQPQPQTINYHNLPVCINGGVVAPNWFDLVVSFSPARTARKAKIKAARSSKPSTIIPSGSDALKKQPNKGRATAKSSVDLSHSMYTTLFSKSQATPAYTAVNTDSSNITAPTITVDQHHRPDEEEEDVCFAPDNVKGAVPATAPAKSRVITPAVVPAVTTMTSAVLVQGESAATDTETPAATSETAILREVWYFRLPYLRAANGTSNRVPKSGVSNSDTSAVPKSIQFPAFERSTPSGPSPPPTQVDQILNRHSRSLIGNRNSSEHKSRRSLHRHHPHHRGGNASNSSSNNLYDLSSSSSGSDSDKDEKDHAGREDKPAAHHNTTSSNNNAASGADFVTPVKSTSRDHANSTDSRSGSRHSTHSSIVSPANLGSSSPVAYSHLAHWTTSTESAEKSSSVATKAISSNNNEHIPDASSTPVLTTQNSLTGSQLVLSPAEPATPPRNPTTSTVQQASPDMFTVAPRSLGSVVSSATYSPPPSSAAAANQASPALFQTSSYLAAIQQAEALGDSQENSEGGGAVTLLTTAPLVPQCVAHRFLTVGGVFNAMGVFGLEGGGEEAAAALPVAAEDEKEKKREGGQDGDAEAVGDDCVVCLGAPRQVAMFPCRHLCLCAECAAAMSEQQVKCPMCRNQVTLMIHFKNGNRSSGGVAGK